MKEIKLAQTLVKDALCFYEQGKTTKPSILLDKETHKNYNFDILKEELNKMGFDIMDYKDAPEIKNVEHSFINRKWLVYQK